jgi:hypothetical protein
LAVEVLEDRALLSTFVVDRLTDTGAGSGLTGDLRYCITNAANGDHVTFADGVTGTINLTGALPALSHSIDIEGPGAASLTVRRDTGGFYRIFTVDSGATVTLSGLTITNGNLYVTNGAGIYNNGGTLTLNNVIVSGNSGGGIYNGGTLTLNNATVSGNPGDGIKDSGSGTITLNNSTVSDNSIYGAGILIEYGGVTTILTLNNSTVSGNFSVGIGTFSDSSFRDRITLNSSRVSGNSGGGITNFGGTLTLNNSTVSDNSSTGIGNYGTATLNNSTVSGNGGPNVHAGGGIINYGGPLGGTLTLNNCTVSGNSVGPDIDLGGHGGGIWNDATLTLTNCTVSGNSIPDDGYSDGGGIYSYGGFYARNTIIAGNTDDPVTGYIDGNYNLWGGNPLLGPLQDNGGPTKTMALLAGSPALNAGDSAQLGVADQRGVVRSGGVNIGAYQASASAFVVTAPATATAGTAFNVTVKAVDTFGQTALGYTGTVHFGSTDGQAVLPGNYAFTGGDAGQHTFTSGVTLETAGSQTVTATDTATSSITGSASVSVSPAAADHLLFLQQPTDTSARQTITPAVTVAVVDQFGNVVTSDNSDTVTLAIGTSPSGGTLSGTLTVTVRGSIATFGDLSIDLAGDGYTLHATTAGLTAADSGAFRIT